MLHVCVYVRMQFIALTTSDDVIICNGGEKSLMYYMYKLCFCIHAVMCIAGPCTVILLWALSSPVERLTLRLCSTTPTPTNASELVPHVQSVIVMQWQGGVN